MKRTKKLMIFLVYSSFGIFLGSYFNDFIQKQISYLKQIVSIKPVKRKINTMCYLSLYNNCSRKNKDVIFNIVSPFEALTVRVANGSAYTQLKMLCDIKPQKYQVCADYVAHIDYEMEPHSMVNRNKTVTLKDRGCPLPIYMDMYMQAGDNMSLSFPGSFSGIKKKQLINCSLENKGEFKEN
jgi:hypothetical protein